MFKEPTASDLPTDNAHIDRGPAPMTRVSEFESLSGPRKNLPLAVTNFHLDRPGLSEMVQLGQETMEDALLTHVPALFRPENVNASFEQGIMTAVRETIQLAAERARSDEPKDILNVLTYMQEDFSQKLSHFGMKGDGRDGQGARAMHDEVKANFRTMISAMKKHYGIAEPVAPAAQADLLDGLDEGETQRIKRDELIAELKDYEHRYGLRPQFMPVGDMVATGRGLLLQHIRGVLAGQAAQEQEQEPTANVSELTTRAKDVEALTANAYDLAMEGPKVASQPLVTMAEYRQRLAGSWHYLKQELKEAGFSDAATLKVTSTYQQRAQEIEKKEMCKHMKASLDAGDIVVPNSSQLAK